jgi:hypothetical protein
MGFFRGINFYFRYNMLAGWRNSPQALVPPKLWRKADMYEYAFKEFRSLASGLSSPIDDRDAVVRYLCALVAELAYYYIPKWEIEGKKRVKLIPCDVYQKLAAKREEPIDLAAVLGDSDPTTSFVAIDRGVVAVGVVINKLLFIGFRGTQFLFDWRTNLRAKLVQVNARFRMRTPFISSTISGRLHSGFGEEAVRISARVADAIRDSKMNIEEIDHVFLTGHSLGGAVAAISENFIKVAPTSVCIFGTPRYADLSAYVTLPVSPPAHIRRSGDAVPTVPPKAFGYADHPYEFSTNGIPYIDPTPYASWLGDVLRWGKFLMGLLEPHSMESYRHEAGVKAGAEAALLPLAYVKELTPVNIGNP